MNLRTISTSPAAPVVPSSGRLRPLGTGEVHITGGFWGDLQSVNAAATLPHIRHWLEREGWLGNFDLAVTGELPRGRRGREFSDSEVYKYLEAVAWQLSREDSDELEADFRAVVSRVGAAQEPDGYLGTNFGREGQQPRWSDLEWGHELYCLGHLFQAAVARMRTRPDSDDGLASIAVRAADLVCDVFGPDGLDAICGHAEIEVGLAELARATNNERYAAQAALFVERRGHGLLRDIENGRSYYQDDLPVRDATVLRGHAVRANYLAAGAVDVAVEGGDSELLDALRTQWAATIARRTYITGGQGAHHKDEAFGVDWELPSDRAYSETCAAIASMMFSWRLLLTDGDPGYADLIERTLYNVVATSPSVGGTAFFYANTLHQREPGVAADPDAISPRASSSLRAPWFEVSCCPPNVARTLASLDAYIATVDHGGLQLHQYATATIRCELGDGRVVAADVETEYPRSGTVRVTVTSDTPGEWTLSLRVPQWATGAILTIDPRDGESEARSAAPGTASVTREFVRGDVVELSLPLEPRLTRPDDRIDAVRGSIAVERGPEVFCVESVDIPVSSAAQSVDDLRFDASTPLREEEGHILARFSVLSEPAREWPFPALEVDDSALVDPIDVRLVPYHSWAERGPSTMRIWLPLS